MLSHIQKCQIYKYTTVNYIIYMLRVIGTSYGGNAHTYYYIYIIIIFFELLLFFL